MQSRRQGSLQASARGCLGMSEICGDGYERESIATMARALFPGSTMLDMANVYGPFTNERWVGARPAGAHGGARGAT